MTNSRSPSQQSPGQSPSPLMAALNLIGDGWTFLILREMFFNASRFDQLLGNLKIPRSRLVERLQNLIDGNVIAKIPYQTNPLRYDYKLTEMGRDIYDMALMEKIWADKWRRGKFPHLELIHNKCGQPLNPVMICKNCKEELTPQTIEKINKRPIAEEGLVINKRRFIPAEIYDRSIRQDAVMETLKVMGDQRTMAILHEAYQGTTRFELFQTRTGIARNTLTLRLNHLVEQNILIRQTYEDKPLRQEYVLSDAGRDLLLIEITLEQWGRKWLFGSNTPSSSYRHTECGAPLETEVICRSCEGPVDPRDVTIT